MKNNLNNDYNDYIKTNLVMTTSLLVDLSTAFCTNISKNITEKTNQTIKSKEKNSLDRIKQIELSAIQSIKSQASIELNKIIENYFSNLSEDNRSRIIIKSVSDLKSVN